MSVKWGVLGTANIAKGCTIPGMKMANNCELYAIAGRSESKVQSYKDMFGFEKAYVGYEKLLEDPEVKAVYIPLPNNLHKEWVIKALKAGKHVLCEKPLALNAEDAKEMFAVAKENNVLLMEAFAYLHTPYIASLKETIKSGAIGEVEFIDTAFFTQYYEEDIRLYKELGGGAVYDFAEAAGADAEFTFFKMPLSVIACERKLLCRNLQGDCLRLTRSELHFREGAEPSHVRNDGSH